MGTPVTTDLVWRELSRQVFAVVGMVTARSEARTVGIVYAVHGRKIVFATGRSTWKVRHVEGNPHVSVTVPIAKRIPLLPWVKIPAATITFQGTAAVSGLADAPDAVVGTLLRGLDRASDQFRNMCLVEIAPQGEFMTYGIGVPLLTMRDPSRARGRAPV